MMASCLKGGLFHLYFETKYRKSHTIKGDTMLKSTCTTKCSILHKSILKVQPRQPAQHSFIPCCLDWCGSVAPEERHCHRATLPQIGRGTTVTYLTVGSREVFIPLPHPQNGLLIHLVVQTDTALLSTHFLSLLHWCPKALKLSLVISPSILERKRSQTRLESRSLVPQL